MTATTKSIAASWAMVAFGVLLLLLAILMVLPVGVNLPASWFGVVLIAAASGAGVALVYRGARRLIART
jgi:hypothetical protein